MLPLCKSKIRVVAYHLCYNFDVLNQDIITVIALCVSAATVIGTIGLASFAYKEILEKTAQKRLVRQTNLNIYTDDLTILISSLVSP